MTKTLTSREQDDMFRLGQADVFGSFLKSIVQNGELKHFDCNILLENALGDSPNPLEMLKVLIQNLPQKEIANFTAALFLPHKEAISGMELVMEKHPDLFHFLNGMDPHKRRRPLHTAFYFFDDKRDKESREHNKQLALWLLEKGALCTSRMVLDIALLDEDIAPFLAHIPNLNLMSEGHLPLHAAATQGRRLSNVEALIDAGADVNARDEKGRTALLCAESPDMVELLLKKGADPLAVDFQGHNLLMVILKDKPTSLGGVVDVLSEVCPQHLDALFAHRGFDGSTVLHHIARQPLPPVFQTFDLPAFLQTPRGSALLDAKDAQGTTPLIVHGAGVHERGLDRGRCGHEHSESHGFNCVDGSDPHGTPKHVQIPVAPWR
jgi:ankyrin repeat protein